MASPPVFRVASDIAGRMRELRTLLGVTQGEFADLFARGRKQASEWERGGQAPPATVLARTAAAQGWPLEIFTEGGRRPAALVNGPLTDANPPGGTHVPLPGTEAAAGRLETPTWQDGYAAGFRAGFAAGREAVHLERAALTTPPRVDPPPPPADELGRVNPPRPAPGGGRRRAGGH